MPGTMNLPRILISTAVLAATALALSAGGAFGQEGQSLSDRLNVSRLFNSAACAITGGDCETAKPPTTGGPADPPPGTKPGGKGMAPLRGKTDVGVFEFTVSGKQTTNWKFERFADSRGCTIHTWGSGTQTIALKSVEPGYAEFTANNDQLLVRTDPGATVMATVSRAGNVKSDDRGCPPVADGGGPPTKPDCDKPISAKIGMTLIGGELDRRGTPVGVSRELDFTALPNPKFKNCPFYGMSDDPYKEFGVILASDRVTSLQLQSALADYRAKCAKNRKCKPKTVTLKSPTGSDATRTDTIPGGTSETTVEWTVVLTPTGREVSPR
jgi:hypothetical protein